MPDRPANSGAPLLTPIGRVEGCGRVAAVREPLGQRRKRVGRAPVIIAIEEEGLAMKLVPARASNSVHHATRRAAIFGRIVRCVHLELLHRRLRCRITDASAAPFFREKRLVIVHPIDGVVVQQHADAAKAQQTVAILVRSHASRQQGEVRPAPAVAGQVFESGVAEVGSDRRRACLQPRSRRTHQHSLTVSADSQMRRERRDSPHLDRHRRRAPRRKVHGGGVNRISIRV